jgi:glyoxylase-like metal-dependent hydrolase (beta-lactamase superfamily II)
MLIYDTGLNDRLVGRPLYENVLDGYAQVKFNTLSGQLADIGVSPANIEYLVLSHYHWDHVGNAGDFAGSTWLVYKGDRDQMFSRAARAYAWFSQYSALEKSKTMLLSGDHDVFGDGTVVVIGTYAGALLIARASEEHRTRRTLGRPVSLCGRARPEAYAGGGKDHRHG